MNIDVKDLPPEYQAQVLRKVTAQEKRKRGENLHPTACAPPKERKYNNKPTERVSPSEKTIKFDSQKEARRYDELMLELRAGKIRKLKLQPQFTLEESYITEEGERIRARRYHADFSYERVTKPDANGSVYWLLVVEDVKSRATRTQVYKDKKKSLRERYGIDIQEV